MIDVFVNRLIELLKTRQENKEKLFTDFVQPAFDAFEKAHREYLGCFQEYQRCLSNQPKLTDTVIHELQERLRIDSLYQYDVRNTAIEEAKIILKSRRYDFTSFIDAINDYFTGTFSDDPRLAELVEHFQTNAPRAQLFLALRLLRYSLHENQRWAKVSDADINGIVRQIQEKRLNVLKAYLDAKKHLLQT